VTLGGNITTANSANYYPGVQRSYQSKKRYRAEDLVDNGDDGSLWSGKKKENFLFVTNNLKNQGDIVIVEVLNDFKEEITAELKRAYPERTNKNEKSKDNKEGAVATNEEPTQKEEEVYDKISTQVIERMNGDYLLIKGRKEVVFNKGRRFVEIQGLISQKNILSNDTVLSDKILEPKIRVLRY
jgi:flagellar basal body L-ring protein FlgH